MAKTESKITRIKRDLPEIATPLVRHFNGKTYNAAIVSAPNLPGGKGVKLNGVVYSSLTAAARSITHTSVNGWVFWKLK